MGETISLAQQRSLFLDRFLALQGLRGAVSSSHRSYVRDIEISLILTVVSVLTRPSRALARKLPSFCTTVRATKRLSQVVSVGVSYSHESLCLGSVGASSLVREKTGDVLYFAHFERSFSLELAQ